MGAGERYLHRPSMIPLLFIVFERLYLSVARNQGDAVDFDIGPLR